MNLKGNVLTLLICQTDRWHSVISMECCSLLLFFFSWPRLYFCLSAISTTVFDVIVCLVFVSSRFDIVKKRVLKFNCVPIFYSFKTPKKRRQMPSWVVACYKQLNQSLLRDFFYKIAACKSLYIHSVDFDMQRETRCVCKVQ